MTLKRLLMGLFKNDKEERKGGEKKEETLSSHEAFYLAALRDAMQQPPRPEQPPEYAARLADLEIKMAKLWSILIESTPAGKDKLSKYGKRFGGMCKERL